MFRGQGLLSRVEGFRWRIQGSEFRVEGVGFRVEGFCWSHPGGNPGTNLKPISHRCHPILVAFVWELTQETVNLPLGCLQGGRGRGPALLRHERAGAVLVWWARLSWRLCPPPWPRLVAFLHHVGRWPRLSLGFSHLSRGGRLGFWGQRWCSRSLGGAPRLSPAGRESWADAMGWAW